MSAPVVKPADLLMMSLNMAGLGRGVTLSSVRRFWSVNQDGARLLMQLREACFDALGELEAPALRCGSCGNRLPSGSCDLDVLDPLGDRLPARHVKNWRNRDTFGCAAWEAIVPAQPGTRLDA